MDYHLAKLYKIQLNATVYVDRDIKIYMCKV